MSLRAAPEHLLGVPVARREFIRVPIVGWVVYLLDFILIDRTHRARAAASQMNLHDHTAALREHFVAALDRLRPEP